MRIRFMCTKHEADLIGQGGPELKPVFLSEGELAKHHYRPGDKIESGYYVFDLHGMGCPEEQDIDMCSDQWEIVIQGV